jgi:hypothetical protein
MQKLLLELGGPLVIAVMLLAIARFVRGLLQRFKPAPPEPPENDEPYTN